MNIMRLFRDAVRPLCRQEACYSIFIIVYLALYDYVIKIGMLAQHHLFTPHTLNHYCRILLVYNRGVAFSLLHHQPHLMAWVHGGVILIMLCLAWAILFVPQRHVGITYALALILGGALGNFIDRMAHGQVLDFISLHYHQYYFAIFNFADTFVSLGLFCLICYHCHGFEINFRCRGPVSNGE